MAKQTGIFPIVGTIDGVNFYYREGKPFARKAGGGFNGKAIKTAPSMVRVRENSSEFGHCSKVKRVFKLALQPFLKDYHEGTLHGRMMRLFQQIKVCDVVSERGKRNLGVAMGTAMGQALLKKFDFTPNRNIWNKMDCGGVFVWNNRRFVISDFDIRQIKFVENANYLKLTLGVLRFDFDLLVYKMELSESLMIEKNRDFGSTNLELFVAEPMQQTGISMAFLGFGFYQKVGTEFYLMKESVGVKILSVIDGN